MNLADILLRRLSLVFSVILVIVLGVIAALSVLRNDSPSVDDVAVVQQDGEDTAAAAPSGPEAGAKIQIQNQKTALSITCLRSPANDGTFVVQITNDGDEAGDFVIAAELQDSFGAATEHTVDATELQPGEARNLPIERDEDAPDSEECFVVAVERDRQVILTGR